MRILSTWIAAAALALAIPLAMADEPAAPAASSEAKPAEAAAPAESKPSPLNNEAQKIGYIIGNQIGRNIADSGIKDEIDVDALVLGLRDVLAGKDSIIPDEEASRMMMQFAQKMEEKITRKHAEDAARNKAESDKFLAENKTKEGVKTTDSGLQYKIIKQGEGASPKPDDIVKVNYRGTLVDGTEFDSSYKRGEPAEFKLNRVIPGWTEGLQMLKEGGKAMLFVPPDLAYGENPRPGSGIGPNSALIFEVELLEVKPSEAPKPGQNEFTIEPPAPDNN
ncbi:MAG: FKBP-type peptidyl-prolyl cis-trans isomerase [Candidatus Sumerlaeia bacterium]